MDERLTGVRNGLANPASLPIEFLQVAFSRAVVLRH